MSSIYATFLSQLQIDADSDEKEAEYGLMPS